MKESAKVISNHDASKRANSPCVNSPTPVAFGWAATPVTGLKHHDRLR